MDNTQLNRLLEVSLLGVRGTKAVVELQRLRGELVREKDRGRELEWRVREGKRVVALREGSSGDGKDGESSNGSGGCGEDCWDAVSVASGSANSWNQPTTKFAKPSMVATKGRFAVPSDKLSTQTGMETRACTIDDRDDGDSVLSRELFQLGIGGSCMLGKRSPLEKEQAPFKVLNNKPFVDCFSPRVTSPRK